MLDLDNFEITRVAVLHIPTRNKDRSLVEPTGGEILVDLAPSAKDMVGTRIVKALGHDSHGLKADFQVTTVGSVFQNSCEMMECTDERFIKLSKVIARQLAVAQQSRPYAKCKLIVMQGTVSNHSWPYVALIKAELQEALRENQSVVDHIKDIFMTESQRLYKVGFIHRVSNSSATNGFFNPEHHAVHIYDHLLTGLESRKAAFYFYNQFLGADLAASDKSLTRDFLEKTLEYVNKQNFPLAKKLDLGEAIRSELRSQEPSISVAMFATKHFTTEHVPLYSAFMTKSGFPTHSINKDVEYVKLRLNRRRKATFSSGVQLLMPADRSDLVEFKGTENGSTIVHIKGTVDRND